MVAWRTIDSAPLNGDTVLVFVPGDAEFRSGVLSARWETQLQMWVCGGELCFDELLRLDTPSHWMPLPNGPNAYEHGRHSCLVEEG
jgi:hypothetical protein